MTHCDDTVSPEVRALTRQLLESASLDGPPPTALPRTAAALGLGALVLSGAAKAAAGVGAASLVRDTKAATLGVAALAKWIAGGALVATVGLGSIQWATQEWATHAIEPQQQRPAIAAARGQASRGAGKHEAATPTSAPQPVAEASADPTPPVDTVPRANANSGWMGHADTPRASTPLGPATPDHVDTAPPADSLASEVSLLDEARSRLGRGQPAVALTLLKQYESRFPTGALRAEALALTIESWLGVGNQTQARRCLERLARAYPQSQQLRRFSSLRDTSSIR
jgi:hypothetical protein